MPVPHEARCHAIVPDKRLSGTNRVKNYAFGGDLCNAPIRLRDVTNQFSIIGEFMLELQGFHASTCIPNRRKRSMLQCNSGRQK
jgi:hypothetical protein